jgi:hypothetical protein
VSTPKILQQTGIYEETSVGSTKHQKGCKIWSFHEGANSECSFLMCDTLQRRGYQRSDKHATPIFTFEPFKWRRTLYSCLDYIEGARGSVVSWGTMLQAGRSRAGIPIRSLDFFNWPNPSSRTMALGWTRPLTEMSTRNFPGGKGRPARKADYLAVFC